jgi:predicted nucleic acid-binding protein
VACEIVWAETASLFDNQDFFLQQMGRLGVALLHTQSEALVGAGKAWRKYRRAGGPRSRIMSDFLVGAQALLQCDRLLTRDRGLYREYFTGLKVIDPSI